MLFSGEIGLEKLENSEYTEVLDRQAEGVG